MTDAVKAEISALRLLRDAVTRYAGQMRDAMDAARRDAATLVKRAEEAQRRRRIALDRALRDLQQAQATLATCPDPRQAAVLRKSVSAAKAYADEAQRMHAYASKAVHTATEAQSNLLKTMQAVAVAVAEDASVAAKALAEIAGKLAEIDPGSGLSRVSGTGRHLIREGLMVAGTLHEITKASGAAVPLPPGYQPVTPPVQTVSEIQHKESEQLIDEAGEWDHLQREKHADDLVHEQRQRNGTTQ
jgi:hypothetical protein